MIRTSRQLKAFVRNLSKGNSTQAQIIIRNYIMERFLERISLSEYRDNFILKGGMLVSAMVGLDTRSTMDIDATIKDLPLTMETAQDIIEKIISVPIDDGVIFTIKSVASILEEAEYGGIRATLEAKIDTMRTPLKVDISTGDVITPQEVAYQFKLMFEERTISIWAYNLETVLAEKLETVISRGTANTRLRDFYDLYVLQNDNSRTFDMSVFPKAFEATCSKRQSMPIVSDGSRILDEITNSEIMMQLWRSYQKKYSYAESITWNEVMDAIIKLFIATRQVK
jgi:predicted nucleotidyltransferase component of viral defense system